MIEEKSEPWERGFFLVQCFGYDVTECDLLSAGKNRTELFMQYLKRSLYFTRVKFDSNKTDNLMALKNENFKKKEIVTIVTILKIIKIK